MSRLRERDEQEALKLDEYFKDTLARVRPYILALIASEDVQLCRVWLDKLSYASTQRVLRNQYLTELCHQLKSGHMEGMFAKPPQSGPLVPLQRPYHMTNVSSSLSEISDGSTMPCQNWLKSTSRSPQRQYSRSKTPTRRRQTDSTGTSRCGHGLRMTANNRSSEDSRVEKSQMLAFKHRIDTLTTIVKELQIQNERLNQELMQCQENCEVKETPRLHVNIKLLTAEVTTLKAKLMEVQKMKEVLESNHKEVVQQYKNTMAEQFTKLQFRLQEAQSKNVTLDNTVMTVTQNLEQISSEKEEEMAALEKEWVQKMEIMQQQFEMLIQQKDKELHMKDLVINQKDVQLTQNDFTQKEEINLLLNKIKELEGRLERKIEDEGKLRDIVTEQCTTMKEEFSKMRLEMETATSKQNQSLVHKISTLKKGILKLEKSKERLGHEYERKIIHILKDKELEIKTLQLQLQGQRSELSTSLSSEKQCELDSLVGTLEERYRVLLAACDTTAGSQQQNFLRKITVLEREMVNLKKNLMDSEPYL